jgi:hypothetical protein
VIRTQLSPRAIEHRAALLGYELKRNQTTRLWHWQVINTTTLDWRGSGYATKTDACRDFAQAATDAGAFN